MLAYHYYQDEVKGDAQDVKNTNTTLRLNYGFDNKYVFEGDGALMGSNRFERIADIFYRVLLGLVGFFRMKLF